MFDHIKSHIASTANGVCRFRDNADGSIKIMTAFMAVPLIYTLGAAVDTAETYRARVNFQNAVDAAVLQAGKTMTRTGSPTEAQTAGERVFHANVENLAPSTGQIQFVIPNGECGTEGVTANATLDHDLFFGGARAAANLFYNNNHDEYRQITLNATATVNCGNDTLEIAMVLDNSGSMGQNGKIGTLQVAAADLINTIHNSMGTSLRQDPVSFSLVPFSTFVNIGAGNKTESWMDQEGASSIHDEHLDWSTLVGATNVSGTEKWKDQSGNSLTRFSIYDALDIDWAGCVDQRPWPYHTTDETPSTSDPDTLFLPSFAPDTPDNLSYQNRYEAQLGGVPYCVRWRSNVNNGCRRWSDGYWGQNHPTEGWAYYYSAEYGYNGVWQGGTGGVNWVNVGPQQEEWYQNNYLQDAHNFDTQGGAAHPYDVAHMGTSGGNQYKRQKWAAKYFDNADPRDVNNNSNGLPNPAGLQGGPNFMCTSAPITDLTPSRQSALDGVADMVAIGATNVQQGVAWGWRTLSEKLPFNQGRPSSTYDNKKIMIVMTDGNNTYYPTASIFGNSYSSRNVSLQGAYGMSVNERIFEGYTDIANPNHDAATFTKAMDSHLEVTCQNAKADGIIIYSIAFDVPNGSSVKETLEYCASPKPGGKKYYDASNNAELIQVFQEIAESIAELAITR